MKKWTWVFAGLVTLIVISITGYASIWSSQPDHKGDSLKSFPAKIQTNATISLKRQQVLASNVPTNSGAFSPDGKLFVATGPFISEAAVWSTSDWKLQKVFNLGGDVGHVLGFSKDSSIFGIGSLSRGEIFLIDSKNLIVQNSLRGFRPGAGEVALMPDGKTVAYMPQTAENIITFFDTTAKRVAANVRLGNDQLGYMYFPPSTNWALQTIRTTIGKQFGHYDFEVRVVELPSLNSTRTLKCGPVLSVSADGKSVATRSLTSVSPKTFDTNVKIWDSSSWQEKTSIRTQLTVGHAALSSNGRYLVLSGMNDRSESYIQVWNVVTGNKIQEVVYGADLPPFIHFSPDDKWVVTTSLHSPRNSNENIVVWEVVKTN